MRKRISNPITLEKAVKYAEWLIIEEESSLALAIRSGADKFNYKFITHIEKGVRALFPEDYFKKRVNKNCSMNVQSAFTSNKKN